MFFNTTDDILPIATKSGASIFVLPDVFSYQIKNALIVEPETKTTITIEQIRGVIRNLSTKQITDYYIIIRPADLMNIEAANALLKNLEEPRDKIHFILLTDSPSKLLPTVLSRSAIYFLRREKKLDEIKASDDKIKDYAKHLIVAKGNELVRLTEDITKTKKNVRAYTLDILSTAIEILYKSYFITNKKVFAKKLPKFLMAYDNINQNGHIKLHLVANLC
ncbi:hypothetical protein IKG10_02375 [Candidatus Saccharibacteria bacterium]|nr:hypothetical protein [Candidatus Saccharibacteria bacterium]